MKIDNFALTMFQSCPIKYKLRALEHWTTRRKSGALGFGGSFHEGLAEWYRTGSAERALAKCALSWPDNMPVDDWRTKEKCLTTLADYLRTYPHEPWKVVGMPDHPMIECTFTLPTGLYLNCWECGLGALEDMPGLCQNCDTPLEPIEYGGIFDGLIEWNGMVYILEHKTTSQLGAYYFNQFNPNNQVTGYIWAAEHLSGRKVGGAVINAIGVYKASKPKFERQLTNRNVAQIATWLQNVRATCLAIQDCTIRGYWPMHTGSCTMYGKCEFHDVHTLATEKEQGKMLETNYLREQWDYEDRDDESA